MNVTGLNFSAISEPVGGTAVNMADLVTDYCTQLNNNVVLVSTLIFAYFFFSMVVLPRSLQAFKELLKEGSMTGYAWLYDDYIKPGYDRLMSLVETLGAGGAIYLVAYSYYWGWPWYTWAVVIICGVFTGLFAIAKLIGYVRAKI